MIAWKYTLWRSAGIAAVLTVAACGGEGGAPNGGASASGQASPSGEASAVPVGGAGGEHGEAGSENVYADLNGDQRTALRLQHLRGFVLAAEAHAAKSNDVEAKVLIDQGILEVYSLASDQFGALDIKPLRDAADADDSSHGALVAKINAAKAALDSAQAPLRANDADLAARMIDIASAIYEGVAQPDFVDTVEYEHSMGAALSALDALKRGRTELRARDARAYDESMRELQAFVALWPSAGAPEHPTPYQDVVRQSSRARLALSAFLS